MRKKLLSVLVLLAMVLSLLPVSALAEENAVETVGTIEDAKDDTVTNEIKLIKDVNLEDTYIVTSVQKITLDLNGHKVTAPADKQAIKVEVGAELTIKDSSTSGEITRPNGTRQYVILNNGTLTISGGTISSPDQDVSTIRNRTSAVKDAPAAKLTISGGKVTGSYIAIGNDCESSNNLKSPELIVEGGFVGAGKNQVIQNFGKATIEGGRFSGCVATWSDGTENGETEIKGGTFNLEGSAISPSSVVGVFLFEESNKALLKISGGTVDGALTLNGEKKTVPTVAVAKRGSTKNEVLQSVPNGVKIEITGGTFSDNPTTSASHIALPNGYGYREYEDTGACTVVPLSKLVTVTFNSQGGSDVPSQTVIKGEETATKPSDPIKDGFVLDGWYEYENEEYTNKWDFSSVVESNVTLYAKWTEKESPTPPSGDTKYTVTFISEEGTSGNSVQVNAGSLVTKPSDPIKTGYSFAGWYKENTYTTAWNFSSDTVGSNITLYAKWTPNSTSGTSTYTIKFNSNGGTGTIADRTTGTDGKLASLPTEEPTREGYTFAGWYTAVDGDTKVTTSTVFTANTTVYAHWTKESTGFEITFDGNGGKVSTEKMKTGEDGKLAKLPDDPSYEGYTFNGWYTAKTDGTKVSTDTVFKENTTVYAQWTKVETPTDPDDNREEYAIMLASGIRNGSVTLSTQSAKPGRRVTITVDPNTDYYASWVVAERSDGRRLSLSQNGQRYTFTMPSYDVTVDVNFALRMIYSTYVPSVYENTAQAATASPVLTFSPVAWRPAVAMGDVPMSSWAYSSAQWAYQNGYLDMDADGTFHLDGPVSHLQMWKIMAQWMGAPVSDTQSVAQWALQNGAARGSSGTGTMTRQNMVEYLYQCCFLMGGDMSVTGNLSTYRDSQLVTSASAKNAWLWAVNKGIISGTADGYLNPNTTINRGEFAAILMRLCQSGIR